MTGQTANNSIVSSVIGFQMNDSPTVKLDCGFEKWGMESFLILKLLLNAVRIFRRV